MLVVVVVIIIIIVIIIIALAVKSYITATFLATMTFDFDLLIFSMCNDSL
jgi:hypothetical protein